MKKILLTVSLAFTLSNGSAFADTVYCVNCGNEATQYANYAQLYQQTTNMVAQLELLRAQAARLNSDTPFSQSSALLKDIMSVVNQGQALGYNIGEITKKFEGQYPEFGKQKGNFFDSYQKWSQTTGDSIKSALMAAGLQMANFETESATADTLRIMNKSATGQMQAIQIGNAVSSEMLDEMRKLRQLNTAQNQAQNAYLLSEKQQADSKEDGLKTFLNQDRRVVKSYREHLKVINK